MLSGASIPPGHPVLDPLDAVVACLAVRSATREFEARTGNGVGVAAREDSIRRGLFPPSRW